MVVRVVIQCDRGALCLAPAHLERGDRGGLVSRGMGETRRLADASVNEDWLRMNGMDFCPWCAESVRKIRERVS